MFWSGEEDGRGKIMQKATVLIIEGTNELNLFFK